ncbi:MAG TPA: BA14K family protein [Hyphomicrobiales bacterium]|nr:BA14K family protein [Hyphomicrobiales bacterium]
MVQGAAAATTTVTTVPVVAVDSGVVVTRVDRTFAIAAAMASRLQAMAAAAAAESAKAAPPPAAVRPAAPASAAPAPAIAALAPAAIVRTGRSALRRSDAEDRVHDVERASRFALCSHYRTFDAATGTYRGFDGVTHACRPGEGHGAGSGAARAAPAPAGPVNAAVVAKTSLAPSGSYAFPW